VITVEDTGRGFPPEVAETIFEPFSQWDVDGHATGGLGIGLALARGIVGLHGGRVEASSSGPGKGSRFSVRLPAAQPLARADGARPEAIAGGRGCKVLVADDNRDAAETLARFLEACGHEVRIAHDGLAAIAECERFEPQVAVLDIGMPGADGYAVARRLRARDTARPRLIALTGWGQEHDRTRALAAGFDYHLTKPADPLAVNELIVKSCREAAM
jgi:CheY-like chemotaxis protein